MPIAQRYKMKAAQPELVRPAQFVMDRNGTDDIVGFVYDINLLWSTMEIVLFEPREFPEDFNMEVISETEDNWPQLLMEALKLNPDMKPEWAELLQ